MTKTIHQYPNTCLGTGETIKIAITATLIDRNPQSFTQV